jgi:hypothetical protein
MTTFLTIFITWALVAIAIVALFIMNCTPSRRERIATAALQGLLADSEDRSDEIREGESCSEATARLAVTHADALMRELDKEEMAR